MEGTQSTAATKTNKRRLRKPKTAKKSAPKESKDFRYLEIVKLIRAYLPITINGIAVTKIIELQLESEAKTVEDSKENITEGEQKTKKRSSKAAKKQKQQIICDHIQRVIARDPTQPIYISFMIPPSDPDFPFDLDTLKFNLTIPSDYPRSAKALPSLIVLNNDIPKGFAVNIERGFKQIARLTKSNDKSKKNTLNASSVPEEEEEMNLVDGKGLLSQVHTLDKYLETFLKQEKRQTMKFISFKTSKSPVPLATPEPTPPPPSTHESVHIPKILPANINEKDLKKRAQAIEEMTTKLGSNVKMFNKSNLEWRYKIVVPISSARNLPQLWTINNENVDIFITVPMEYPRAPPRVTMSTNFSTNLLVAKKKMLQDCGKTMVELVEEAKKAEKNLRTNVDNKINGQGVGLVSLLNWISNNLSLLVLDTELFGQWRENVRVIRG